MAHHDKGRSRRAAPTGQEVQYLHSGMGVEIPRRFIGKDDRGVFDKRAGYCYTLLFPAGKLMRKTVFLAAKADERYMFPCEVFIGPACEFEREEHIFDCRKGREQVEELKNETQLIAAKLCPASFTKRFKVDAVNLDTSAGWFIKTGKKIEKRCFSRAALSEERYDLALLNIEFGPPQGLTVMPPGVVFFPQVVCAYRGCHNGSVN